MAVGDNKRRLDRLERRVEILEDELDLDHSDVLEAGDDGELVPDGGEEVDPFEYGENVPEGSCTGTASCGLVLGLDGEEMCDVWDPSEEWVCTRPEGHEGPHVACADEDHGLEVWTDEDLEDVQEDEVDEGPSTPPENRLREALKQLTIARDQAAFDDVVTPALDEAEVLLRGTADRLEGQGFPGEVELSPSEIVNGADDADVQEAIDQASEDSIKDSSVEG